ncbi:related to Probable transporter MCH4 [Saccharomycodes ludwigii]|uniref:Related to Probable transporter MCH4 n=1 Tax=Saccharomycodes ludwigii TaxID=36035 RepID=A0A376B8E5_9ASCO|nr:hypothetical protein SCDLUD_005035 [Saccharomycodes ludwigii]KAH3898711.1 hypothetical protein SCDLUD_005035 [Saccharomycodes ludwigii]SSD60804.1 related to Probable transporter MCH4 [Saccharomycodes ludwigii]
MEIELQNIPAKNDWVVNKSRAYSSAYLHNENEQIQDESKAFTLYEQQPVTIKNLGKTDEQETEENFASSLLEEDDEESFPEGGIQAYLVVFGSFMGLIPVFGMINSLGAIQSYISYNQLSDVKSSTVSWIFSIFLAISFVSCVFTGAYFDRNGGFIPMAVGSLFYVGGIMGLANCTKVWHFILSFALCTGCATGILTTPLVSCVATWFYKKRALATSIASIGGSIGGIVFPIMLRKLYVEVGFQWAIRILGFICLVCLLTAVFLAKERKNLRKKIEPFDTKWELIKWYVSNSFNWKYFLDLKFLFAALGASFAENSLTCSATFLASYSILRGNSQNISYALITVTNAAGILGRYIPGYLADKCMGRFNVVIITISFAALFNFVLWLPFGGHIGCLWAYVCLYGFSSGSILSLTPSCIGQISKTSEFGQRYSTTYLIEAAMTLPIIPIGGAIIGDGKSVKKYNDFIVFSTMLMVTGVICYIISRVLCVGFAIRKF